MRLRKELFRDYTFNEVLAADTDTERRLLCYANPAIREVKFLFQVSRDQSKDKWFENIDDAIAAWNNYKLPTRNS